MLGELSVRGRTVGRCKKHADESRRNVRTRGTENTQTTTHNQGGPPGRPSQIPSMCSLFPRALWFAALPAFAVTEPLYPYP